MAEQTALDPDIRRRFALPLVIAVTGHRDLVDTEIPEIRARVRNLFEDLAGRYPERPLSVMSSLAEGADRLVAEAALEMGLRLIVPLPMPRDIYVDDFKTDASRQEFDRLCAAADELFELPLAQGNGPDDACEPGPARNLQYAQLGVFLAAHCHLLLALWDGKVNDDLGGTGQVVRFHHDDLMPGYVYPDLENQQMLVDDESDLVYHIVCSRDRPDGAPREGLTALDCWWFTKDETEPLSRELPAQHDLIFKRSEEFSRDAMQHAERIEREKYALLVGDVPSDLPDGIQNIDRIYSIADWLAIHFQRKMLITLRVTHILTFLMGLMFILYSDLATHRYYLVAFFAFFLVAAGVQLIATRRDWHRRHLDYRALAEGLRVQFYWAAAGVDSGSVARFTHDSFLQSQDVELGWIRNVMRVAGTRHDAMPTATAEGLAFVLKEWIGDMDSGQLGYYRRKALERIKRSRLTSRLSLLGLLVTVFVVGAIAVYGTGVPDGLHDPLIVTMGATLLLIGVRHGYAYSTAEKELIKQYEFMLGIYRNALRRMDTAESDTDRRKILRALGRAALNEQAEWILLHRDRSPEQGELWVMRG